MNKLTDLLGLKRTKQKDDFFTGIVTEDGVVKSSAEGVVSMSFSFCAYIKNDSEVIEEDIFITKDIRSFNTKIKGIKPLTIVQISGEEFIHYGQNRINLNKLIKSNVENKKLEAILAKRKEPVIYDSHILGKFQLDRRLDWFEGKTEWNESIIEIFLAGDLEKLDITEKNAILIVNNQKDWDTYIKEKISEELLPLKNENWLKDDENPLTAQEFISKLFLESITVNDSDEFQMCFNDGDLFWDHAIMVETDLNKKIEHIGIAG